MIRGSCLCGRVSYELDGKAVLINHCHCSMCRKFTGAAFGSFLHASSAGFRWVSGTEYVAEYQSSENNRRAFCRTCGSPVPVVEAEHGDVNIPAGSLDSDPGLKPCVHIFVGSKAPWFEITDSLTQFDMFPPEEWIRRAMDEGD